MYQMLCEVESIPQPDGCTARLGAFSGLAALRWNQCTLFTLCTSLSASVYVCVYMAIPSMAEIYDGKSLEIGGTA